MNATSDRSSATRKRALRRLAREEHAAYSAAYEDLLREAPGLTRFAARGQAWTRLRHQFPGRYAELFAEERAGVTTAVPAGIRSKSWQRASGQLAGLRAASCREASARFLARGMSRAKAYERAMAALREAEPDLFARLLAHEYELWLEVAGPPQAVLTKRLRNVPGSCRSVPGAGMLDVSCRGLPELGLRGQRGPPGGRPRCANRPRGRRSLPVSPAALPALSCQCARARSARRTGGAVTSASEAHSACCTVNEGRKFLSGVTRISSGGASRMSRPRLMRMILTSSPGRCPVRIRAASSSRWSMA